MVSTKILLIGSDGSMGTRYQSIFKFLNLSFDNYDTNRDMSLPNINDYSHVVVATPTTTHHNYLSETLKEYPGAVLCEKPINLNSFLEYDILDLSMVMQYAYLIYSDPIREMNEDGIDFGSNDYCSYYDYFRTGKDGLYWDCLQIIGLHTGGLNHLTINNRSPIWRCSINGERLSIADMDRAYVDFIHEWISGRRFKLSIIKKMHEKVEQFIKVSLK